METVESSNFTQVIQDHLALKERNRPLERSMPLDRYKTRDPFENHPLFKTEEQARIEETMDGVQAHFASTTIGDGGLPWPGEETAEHAAPGEIEDTGFWPADRARDFDWGD